MNIDIDEALARIKEAEAMLQKLLLTECRICGKQDCDDDCKKLQVIYREFQREKLRNIDIAKILSGGQ